MPKFIVKIAREWLKVIAVEAPDRDGAEDLALQEEPETPGEYYGEPTVESVEELEGD